MRFRFHQCAKAERTSGTCSFSACEEAASVVTRRLDRRAQARCLNGRARGALNALLSMSGESCDCKKAVRYFSWLLMELNALFGARLD